MNPETNYQPDHLKMAVVVAPGTEIVKLTFTLNDISRVAQELSRTIRRFMGEHNFQYEHILISMPRPFNSALGWFINGHTASPPAYFRGVKIVPAYENKITVFFPDYQMFDALEIKPVSIDLNNPLLYA